MSFYAATISIFILVFGVINITRIVLFLVGSDIYGLQKQLARKRYRPKGPLPSISVVIPAHNEEATILHSLRSVVSAGYPKEKLTVIVVDDGSRDRTAVLVKEYVCRLKLQNVILVRQKRQGKAHALNNGIRYHARGEIVMCLDGDSTIASDALQNVARYFDDKRVVAIAANVKIRAMHTLLNLVQRFEYVVSHQMKRALTVYNIEYIIGGVGSSFRRTALRKVGYFDTDTLTEDIDLTMKFLQLGNKAHRVIYASDVVTYTESVLDIRGLIRQRFRWKYGRFQTFVKNASLFFDRSGKNSKLLTWGYLPFAFIADFTFFFEPFMVSYIAYIILRYQDWATLLAAVVVISSYITLNIIAEDTIQWREKIVLVALAPSMYILFYLLSIVEYIALIRSYAQFKSVRASIGRGVSVWEHVERAARST